MESLKKSDHERYDLVVVGGGPAGSMTAAELAGAGHRVLLLDKAAFPRHKACSDYLNPAGTQLLAEIGVSAGPEVRQIVAEVDENHPAVWSEQMMPIMPVVRVATRRFDGDRAAVRCQAALYALEQALLLLPVEPKD